MYLYECNNISKCATDIDNLMKQYEKQKKIVLRNLILDTDNFINKVWKNNGYLLMDNHCNFNMGNGNCNFSCFNCRNISRLLDVNPDCFNSPFQIEYGENEGLSLVVENYGNVIPKLYWDENVSREVIKYTSRYNLFCCGTNKNVLSMKYLKGDSFTIETLIKWFLEKVMEKNNMNYILKSYSSFICNNNGFSLRKYSDIGSFEKLCSLKEMQDKGFLLPHITKSIILQLLVTIKSLTPYNFSHGTPCYKSLLFGREKITFNFEKGKIKSPITLYLNNLKYSSISIKNIHLSCQSKESDLYLKKISFTPNIKTKSKNNYFCENKDNFKENKELCEFALKPCNWYKLENETLDVYTSIRHIGFPLFIGSFDFYCFLVSLMTCESFYYSLFSDGNLVKFWNMLWTKKDIMTINERLKSHHQNNEYLPYNIIKGLWLRCDVVDYCFNILKNLL